MLSFGSKLAVFFAFSTLALAQTTQSKPVQTRPLLANVESSQDLVTGKPNEPLTKQWKFAVVSIRKHDSGGAQRIGVATADGYQMKNLFLGYLIRIAYVPQTTDAPTYFVDQLLGLPAWLTGDDDRYDLDAKVEEADLADWQDRAKQPVMLRSMLQAMLEDRLKLVVHRGTREGNVDQLFVAKNGPKFNKTDPGDPHSGTRPMPGGGRLSREEKDGQMALHYFDLSIGQLAVWVLGTGRPVVDRTGLTGRYDFTVVRPLQQPSDQQQSGGSTPDVDPSAASIANQLGLKLQSARGPVETLVVDHVERPSPN